MLWKGYGNLYSKNIFKNTIMQTTIPDFPKVVTERSTLTPTTLFEIGASNGTDAFFLQNTFNIEQSNVYCFEPNPNNFNQLETNYSAYNNFNIAASDSTGKKIFQCHIPAWDISSFKKRISHYAYEGNASENYYEFEIQTYRMDDFINEHNINNVDLCKIDVEGCTYEVLNGFGDKLSIVGALHIEGELIQLYEDQKLFADFEKILINAGFTMVDFKSFDGDTQCDSVWINNKFLK